MANSADPLITTRLANGGAENMASFVDTFGLPDDDGYLILADDFDAWITKEYYSGTPCDAAYFPHIRNRVRYAISRMATSEDWVGMGNEQFDISVKENGASYKVAKAAKAFLQASVDYAPAVDRLFKTKTDRVRRLIHNADMATLDFETRVKAVYFRSKGAELTRRIKQEMANYSADYEDLMKEITDQTGATLTLPPADDDDDDSLV